MKGNTMSSDSMSSVTKPLPTKTLFYIHTFIEYTLK